LFPFNVGFAYKYKTNPKKAFSQKIMEKQKIYLQLFFGLKKKLYICNPKFY